MDLLYRTIKRLSSTYEKFLRNIHKLFHLMLYEEGRFGDVNKSGRGSYGVVVWILLVTAGMILGDGMAWLSVLSAALLHELGHYVMAVVCGAKVAGIRLGILGARMRIEGVLSYGKEFGIALGGPAVNALCAISVWWLSKGRAEDTPFQWFFYASCGLAFLNLLPVGTLDGGRMMSALLSHLLSPEAAMTVLRISTTLCLLALWLLAGYALLRGSPVLSSFIFILALMLKYLFPQAEKRK